MEELRGVGDAVGVAEGIANFGFMAVVSAFFLVVCMVLLWTMVRMFRQVFIENSRVMNRLVQTSERSYEAMLDLSEALTPETLERARIIGEGLLDVSAFRVCELIGKMRVENHLNDKEATLDKIRMVVGNMHDERNSKLDNFKFKGLPLSSYTSVAWTSMVCDVMESELYKEENVVRTRNNVMNVYGRLKLEYYKALAG